LRSVRKSNSSNEESKNCFTKPNKEATLKNYTGGGHLGVVTGTLPLSSCIVTVIAQAKEANHFHEHQDE